MIHRHNRCLGLTLFRWGRRQVEIWFCPKGEIIERHSHAKIDSRIILMCGRMFGDIGTRYGHPRKFKSYLIPAGTGHGAKVERRCIFLNIETWKPRASVTSAAIDFESV